MSEFISTLGLQNFCTNNLVSGQYKLSILNGQLATGKKSLSLSDYTSSEAQQLMNLGTSASCREGFKSVSNNINLRLTAYDKTLTGIEDIAALANSTTLSALTYNEEQNGATASQLEGYMRQVAYYLNQKVGDRYIFAGARFNTAPVSDLTVLPVPPTETSPYLATNNAVPAYDTDYDANNPYVPVPSAYVKDQVSIDLQQKLQYGVTSNDTGFQQLIMGLRLAYAATQDQTNYETYMNDARDLINNGLSNIRGTHTDVTNSLSTLQQTMDMHDNTISDLQTQMDTIQNVDINKIAIQLTTFQASLEASYSATANLTRLSILKYL